MLGVRRKSAEKRVWVVLINIYNKKFDIFFTYDSCYLRNKTRLKKIENFNIVD
jgi:hypothetical protein